MALIDLEVYWESTDITSSIIEYTRELDICSGVGNLSISVPLKDANSYLPWEEIVVYEDGNKVGTFFISEIERKASKGDLLLRCQDGSKRLSDYFIAEMYEIEDGDYTKTWIEFILNLAGVSYSFSGTGDGTILAGHSIGYDSAFSLLMTLIQQSGWYMYFNPNNTCIIGNLDRDLEVEESFNTTDIISIRRNQSDKMLRNRVVVYGTGINVEQEVNTPWNYDEDDDRTVVIANPYFRDEAAANEMAATLLSEFAKLTDEKEVTVTGFRDVTLGDNVFITSNVFTGKAKITSLTSRMTSAGATTTLILDKRCPRLFTYFSPYYEGLGTYVYIGTWGNGVWRKPLWSSTWEEYNQGLTNLYIKDLFVKDGVLVCVADNGFAYQSHEIWDAWTRVWHGDFEDNNSVIYGEEEIQAVACTIDVYNNLVIGYKISGGDSETGHSWVYTQSGGGAAVKEHIATSGVSNYNVYDIASYDGNKNMLSCEGNATTSGIVFIGNDDMYNWGTFKNLRNEAYGTGGIYQDWFLHQIPNSSYTVLPQSLSDEIDIEDGVDYDSYSYTMNSDSYGSAFERNDDTNRYIIYLDVDEHWAYPYSRTATIHHLVIDESSSPQITEDWSDQFNSTTMKSSLTFHDPMYCYYDEDNYYYVIHFYQDVYTSKWQYTHWEIKRQPNQVSRTEYTYVSYDFQPDLMHNGYLYGICEDDVSGDVVLYKISILTGVCTEITHSYEHTPAEARDGFNIVVYDGVVYGYVPYCYIGTNDTVVATVVIIDGDGNSEEQDLYESPEDILVYRDWGSWGYHTHTCNTHDDFLGSINVKGNIYANGPLEDKTGEFDTNIYYRAYGSTIDETIYEDVVSVPYTASAEERDISGSYSGYFTPIVSNFFDYYIKLQHSSPFEYTVFDLDGNLVLNTNLSGMGAITSLRGVSPTLDSIDDTLYIRVPYGSYSRIYGVDTSTGAVTKKFDTDLGYAASMTYFSTNGNYAVYPDKILLFTDYTVLEREFGSTGKILHHINNTFSSVLYPSQLSKIEISQPSPTIVYNVTSGGILSNVYYSILNTSGSFTALSGLDYINSLRVFNYMPSGEDGAYGRYITYTTPSGVYMLTCSGMENSTPELITFSGIPIQIETSNYGYNPYLFVTTSGPQQFWQRNPYASGFTNMSINLPSGLITIIRLDDAY